MYNILPSQIKLLIPHAEGEYIAAFIDVSEVLDHYGINNRLRVCHFLAQVFAETGGCRVFTESLRYSPLRLTQVWPSHFHNIAEAEPYAYNEQALGNYIYGYKIHKDLGNTQPGDGFRFRGRGLLQITGRAAYEKYGTMLGIPLVEDPDLAYDHRHSLALAAAEFSSSRHKGRTALVLSDEDDVSGVTFAINGGQIGLDQRRLWLQRAKAVFKATDESSHIALMVTTDVSTEGSSRALANAWRQAPA